MFRSALFLAALVLFSGIYAEEASKNVTSEESSKSVSTGESTKLLEPGVVVDYLHPYPVNLFRQEKKYSFFCDVKVNFFKAWRNCMDIKQKLATVESEEESVAFKDVIGSYSDYVYTSGTDNGKEGSWIWLVNNRLIQGFSSYLHWADGQPDNFMVENCLTAFNNNGKIMWNDVPCNNEYCYVCQELVV